MFSSGQSTTSRRDAGYTSSLLPPFGVPLPILNRPGMQASLTPPPMTLSFPTFPTTRSQPGPPSTVSRPFQPSRMSSPPNPFRTSLPDVPNTFSWPLPASTLMPSVDSGFPSTTSLPGPVRIFRPLPDLMITRSAPWLVRITCHCEADSGLEEFLAGAVTDSRVRMLSKL